MGSHDERIPRTRCGITDERSCRNSIARPMTRAAGEDPWPRTASRQPLLEQFLRAGPQPESVLPDSRSAARRACGSRVKVNARGPQQWPARGEVDNRRCSLSGLRKECAHHLTQDRLQCSGACRAMRGAGSVPWQRLWTATLRLALRAQAARELGGEGHGGQLAVAVVAKSVGDAVLRKAPRCQRQTFRRPVTGGDKR